MPLTAKGEKIMSSMKKTYGVKKGKQVFYASQNKGTIKGAHKSRKSNPLKMHVKAKKHYSGWM